MLLTTLFRAREEFRHLYRLRPDTRVGYGRPRAIPPDHPYRRLPRFPSFQYSQNHHLLMLSKWMLDHVMDPLEPRLG